MNKDELRIRIIPEDGQVLIETHTDGIVKCKERYARLCQQRIVTVRLYPCQNPSEREQGILSLVPALIRRHQLP